MSYVIIGGNYYSHISDYLFASPYGYPSYGYIYGSNSYPYNGRNYPWYGWYGYPYNW